MTHDIEVVIERARVLSCATRIEIWNTVGIGMYPSDIATTLQLSPATVTFHLNRLRAAGLVEVERQGRHRLYRCSGIRLGIVTEDELEAAVDLAACDPG